MMGTAHLMLEQQSMAESQFAKAVDLAGDELDDVLYHIGTSWLPAGNIEMAIRYFEQSFSVNPENEMLLNDLGYFYDQLGFAEKAFIITTSILTLILLIRPYGSTWALPTTGICSLKKPWKLTISRWR